MNTNSVSPNAFEPRWERDEPDFINDTGIKWWLDKETTHYAKRENHNGTKLDYQVFVVEKPDGYKTRIILDEKRQPIYEHQRLEDIAVKIDILKLIKERGDD